MRSVTGLTIITHPITPTPQTKPHTPHCTALHCTHSSGPARPSATMACTLLRNCLNSERECGLRCASEDRGRRMMIRGGCECIECTLQHTHQARRPRRWQRSFGARLHAGKALVACAAALGRALCLQGRQTDRQTDMSKVDVEHHPSLKSLKNKEALH